MRQRMPRASSVALGAALLLAGALAWWLQLRPPLRAETRALLSIPAELGAWHSLQIPVEEAVESMLNADEHVQRVYRHPLGELVWTYVGYYGTRRGGQPEHTPSTCYLAHGWTIQGARKVRLSTELAVNEFIVTQGGQRRLVYFWYRSHRRTGMTTRLSLALDHLLARVSNGRADGALVRVSTPLDAGEDAFTARSRLASFAREFEEQLAQHWPVEVAGGGA